MKLASTQMETENNTSSKSKRNSGSRKCKSKNDSNSMRDAEENNVSLDNQNKYPVSNGEILKYLDKEETSSYLKSILEGKIKSERHDIVREMFRTGKLDFGIQSKIFHLTQPQFLYDDKKIDLQLSETMNRILDAVDLSHMYEMAKRPTDTINSLSHQYSHHYIYHVLVPEAILKYLQYKNGWDKERAESFFQDGESRITDLELQEFEDELDEDVKRKRDRMLQEQYDTSDESDEEMYMNYKENDNEIHELPNIDEIEVMEEGISRRQKKSVRKVSER